MAERLPSSLLKHVATPRALVVAPAQEWIEGEPGAGAEPVDGTPFACILFLPAPGAEQSGDASWRPRTIVQPTLLYNMRQRDGSMAVLSKDSDVKVFAADLAPWTGAETVRWQVDGEPQGFGPPGANFGSMATLKRVED